MKVILTYKGKGAKLVCTNISKFYADIIVKTLNDKLTVTYGDIYFEIVEDDYILQEFGG